ncbi:MAG: hypothetical protein IKJ43_00585 [Bacilli bacterium]|nr:hypothetical protein [Bacilli bacterium]
MTRFRINIKQLSNSCSDFNSDYAKYNTAINNYYDSLSSIGSAWSDDNTEYYVNKNKHENRDVDDFNKNACEYIRAIAEFSGRMANIASRCGVVNPNILSYDGGSALNSANSCGSANGSFGWAKYTLSHYWAPNSFRYKWQYDNLRYQMQDLANRASTIEQEIRSIYDDVESAINNLKDISSRTNIEDIHFEELNYKGYVGNAGTFYMPDESDAKIAKYGASESSVVAENDVASSDEVDTIVSAVGHPIKNTDAEIYSDYKGEVIDVDSKDFVSTRDEKDIHSDYEGKVIDVDSKDFVSTRDEKDIHSDYKGVRVESKYSEVTKSREGKKTDSKSSLNVSSDKTNMNIDSKINVNSVDASQATEQVIDDNDIEILSTDVSQMGASNSAVGNSKTEISSAHISEADVSSAGIEVNKSTPTSSTKISSMDASSGSMEVSGTKISSDKIKELNSSEILNG